MEVLIRAMRFIHLFSTVSVLMWLAGCGGPVASRPVQQVAANVEVQARQTRLQEQLLKQMVKPAPTDYQDYQVGPEDLLEIIFLDSEKLRAETRVNGQGQIRLMLVGDVQVAGLTPQEIAQKLARLYKEGDYLKEPSITVIVKEFKHQRVAVTGAVIKPDFYPLIGPRSLLEMLGVAGGLSDKAGEVAHIIRRRPGSAGPHGGTAGKGGLAAAREAAPQPRSPGLQAEAPPPSFSAGTETIVVDLNRLLLKGDMSLNFSIKNGDVVYIPYAKTAYVLGAVAKPGAVLLKDNMTVAKAIAETGGLHILLASSKATVLRMDENGQRQVIPVNLSSVTKGQEEDVPLKENDIVFVQESGIRRFLFEFKTLLPGSVSVAPAAMF
jgi:polysaccharide export outer membrane protein